MIILGIAHSHEAHACILKDGKLLNCVAEERLSRLKAESSFPKKAVDFVLKDAGCKPSNIDIVAVCGLSGRLFLPVLQQNARFSVDDFVAQQNKYWRPKLIEGKQLTQADEFNMFSSAPLSYTAIPGITYVMAGLFMCQDSIDFSNFI